MSVQKDAGELLVYIYKKLVQDKARTVSSQDVLDETKWESTRINFAYDYLNDLGLFKVSQGIGNMQGVYYFHIFRLYPGGINIVENVPEFKRQFGFEVNIGVCKFSWTTTEK